MWLTGWSKRIKLTTDSTKIDADLTHFPITVFLKAGNGDTTKVFQEVGANKLKIAIADDSNPPVQYYVEIELWDNVNQVGVLHFGKTGETLPSASNKDYYLYYDSTHADNTTYVGDIGSTAGQAVWDANFVRVYHGKDLTTSSIADSKGNSNLTKKTAGNPSEINGKVGKGQSFNSSYVYDSTLGFSGNSNFTIEGLGKSTVNAGILAVGDSTSDGNVLGWRLTLSSANAEQFAMARYGGYWQFLNGTKNTIDGLWHYVAATYQPGTNGMKLYIDGVFDAQRTNVESGSQTANNVINLCQGFNRSNVYPDQTLEWDEARVSNVVRSPAWIKATYNSLWDTLLTYGTEEEQPIEAQLTAAGIVTLEAEVRSTIACITHLETEKSETHAGSSSLEAPSLSTLASFVDLEYQGEVSALACLVSLETEKLSTLASLVTLETEKLSAFACSVSLDTVAFSTFASVSQNEKTVLSTLASLSQLELTSYQTIAAIAQAEKTTFSTFASSVKLDTENILTLAASSNLEATAFQQFALNVSLDSQKLASFANSCSLESYVEKGRFSGFGFPLSPNV